MVRFANARALASKEIFKVPLLVSSHARRTPLRVFYFMQLRPYQLTFINNIRESIKLNKHILACAATGSGKSKVFISIAKGSVEKNRTVLIVSESTKIYGQIHKEIGATVNIGDGIKDFYVQPNKIYVAMAQTLAKRPNLIKQFQDLKENLLIINDEAHIGTATKLLKQLTDAYLIGFTATPNYKDAKHLPELYKSIVIGPQAQELVEQNYLSPYFHYERQIADLSKLKKKGSEYTEDSQKQVFQKAEVFDGFIEDLQKFLFHKCMVFCASIEHCTDTVNRLRALNYNVSECHSKNKQSDFELFQFTNGANNICVSVGSLTKGFDEPAVDLIVLLRATLSLSLYSQMCGRGSRLFLGKSKFTVLDYGGNGTRHKPWNYLHAWDEMWNKLPKEKGVAPIKICKGCGFMMAVSVNPCPECGEITIHVPSEKEVKETQLVEITANYNKLRGRNISTLSALELFHYVSQTNKKEFAKRIAKAKGALYLNEYAKLMKWKYGWQNHTVADTKLNYADIIIK